jgi:dephospho-CoA kinase
MHHPDPGAADPQDRLPYGCRPEPPIVIGIVGGVGSGKSTVARMFEDHGFLVADADQMSHAALVEPEIRDKIVEKFGSQILDVKGVIDRERLRPLFDVPPALHRLESILHPVLLRRIRERIQEARARGLPGVVIDAPLLLEVGLDRLCHVLVMVHVPVGVRRARAEQRGMSAGDWARREKLQKSILEKQNQADHCIDNNAPLPEVRRRVEALARFFLRGEED